MNEPLNEEPDPILDVFLEDLLAERSPPDLTQRILAAWNERQNGQPHRDALPPAPRAHAVPASGRGSVNGAPANGAPANGAAINGAAVSGAAAINSAAANGAGHPALDLVTRPLPDAQGSYAATRTERPDSPSRPVWGWAAALTAMLVIGLGLGIAALKWMPGTGPNDRSSGDLARQETPRVNAPGGNAPNGAARSAPTPLPQPAAIADTAASDDPLDEEVPFGDRKPATTPPLVAESPLEQPRWPAPEMDTTLVAYVDQSLADVWAQRSLQPSAHAAEEQWCRRVFVRLLGRIPTVEELNTFVADSAPDKHARLIDRLQGDPSYAPEFARYWATFWTNTLIGRSAGTQPGEPASRAALEAYLAQAWLEDRPFRTVAYELLAATGAGKPGSADFNPAANFLLATHTPDAVPTTAQVARVFLGQRVQCSQCHDHPSNPRREQSYFWQLNAFFRQLDVRREGEPQVVRLADRDAAEDEVYFEQMDGYTRAAYPVLPDGTALPTSGKLADVNRREQLARWVADSRELPRAVVNRVWAHFFGYGFTRPVDDMGEHNPPLHAELLEELAEQFAAHDYSLRKLTRWVALSDAFRRSSEVTEHNVADAPERGGMPLFSRYYTRQMQPEAVYESLRLVADARQSGKLSSDADRAVWLGQFAPGITTEEAAGAHGLGQSLILAQPPVMQDAVNSETGAVLRRVLGSDMSVQKKLEHLFLAAVARKPNASEQALAEKMVAAAGERPQTALEDIWWALLNSNEFLLDH